MKLSVIIPAYNEEKTIAAILDRVREVQLTGGMEKELIIVDDHSSDDTAAAFIQAYSETHSDGGIRFFKHDRNLGKGAALERASNTPGDFVVIQDADLEYDPNEYNALLLQPLLDGHADVVYGSRYAGGKAHRILFFGIRSETSS